MLYRLLFPILMSLLAAQPLFAREEVFKEGQIGREDTPKPSVNHNQTVSVLIDNVYIPQPSPASYENDEIYIEDGGSANADISVILKKPPTMAVGYGHVKAVRVANLFPSLPPYAISSEWGVVGDWGDQTLVQMLGVQINASEFSGDEYSLAVEYESSSGVRYRSKTIKVIVLDGTPDSSSSSSSSSSTNSTSSTSSSSTSSTMDSPYENLNIASLKEIQLDAPNQLAYLTYGDSFPYFSVRGGWISGIIEKGKSHSHCLPEEIYNACDLDVSRSHSSTTHHGRGYGQGGPGFGIFVQELNTHSSTHEKTLYKLDHDTYSNGQGTMCLYSAVFISSKNRRRGWYQDEQEIYVTCPLEFVETQNNISDALSPIARCHGSLIASSPSLIGEFNDSGSHSVSGSSIVSWKWGMQGVNGYAQADHYSGVGPITATLFGGTPTSAEIHATLTVTDELGKSGSATCTVKR